jgi:hypothetical protein
MEKKIRRIALFFFLGVFLLAILWPYESKLVHWDKTPDYHVLESDEIYFNNTRAVLYRTDERIELQKQGFKSHRYNKQLRDTSQPYVNFTIVNNWRQDMAYILLEPSAKSHLPIIHTIVVGDTAIDINLVKMGFEEHYELAAVLFEQSLSFQRPFLLHDGDSLLLYGTQGNEKANQTVLKDYFRLIGRYQ